MMGLQNSIEEIAKSVMTEASGLNCNDVSIICSQSDDSQVRFANNDITLVNRVRNITIDLYISKDRKRIVGTSYNPTEEGIARFVRNLVTSCESLPASESYAPLPQGPFEYKGNGNFDPKVTDAPLVDYVKQAIDEGLRAGATRVSGSLNTETTSLHLLTSAGSSGSDKQSQLLLNVRAFADDDASGHGLSCSSYVSHFEPEAAGRRAGEYAKKALNPKQIQEGKYNVIFTPTVIANILPVASSASAFAIDSGNSFLVDKLGQDIAVNSMNIDDYGVFSSGLGGRIFDDEGTPTQTNHIVSNGRFTEILHNSTTAKKFGKRSTGSAGIISPVPRTIVFREGNQSFEEMIRETKQGILITNNWYTRYQNMRTGEYSTVPRDAAFKVEGGELKDPVAGLRVSDSIPRQLMNIESISKNREWIRWWEVSTPTLAPAIMVKDVHITKAVGS